MAQLDFTEFMADHPYMWGVLGALVVIAAFLVWHYRRRIPTTDWPFTVRVDDHLAPVAIPTTRAKIFDAVLVEKVVFMALVSVIFSQILPDVRSGTLGIAVGVAALVVANTLVTEFIYRRGHSWNSTASAVVATLAINVVLVLLDAWLSPRRDAPTLVTLFFVLMLSLLIALFDRYRATRGASDLRTPAIAAWREERRRKEVVA